MDLRAQAPFWSTLACSESYFPACGPTSPRSQSPPVTAWHRNWCLHIFSLFLSFFPLSPNNSGHVSPHPVFPFDFRIVSRHGDEAPSPPHPFCCLVVLYCFGDPLFCFLAFFSSRSFGLFSLTCPRMQQPDFRDADPYRIPHAKDTDTVQPRSYKTCRPEENDSYATEVRCGQGAVSPWPAGLGKGLQERGCSSESWGQGNPHWGGTWGAWHSSLSPSCPHCR